MKSSAHFPILLGTLILLLGGCSLFTEETFLDDGKNIRIVFEDGLHEDARFKLPKDTNSYYYMTLTKEGQNAQRISMRLLDGEKIVDTRCCGPRQKITWSSNRFWWILAGDTVANITKTYFNTFTGQLQYSNLPPLINWKDELVPTINPSSITDEFTGRASTMIAPIGKMKGDTLTVYARYYHSITRFKKSSNFTTLVGSLEIVDSVKIVLR